MPSTAPARARTQPEAGEVLAHLCGRYRRQVSLSDIAGVALRHRLAFLVLFGSQVTGPVHAKSDIDFAFAPVAGADPDRLDISGDIAELFRSDWIDAVDLRTAGPLLRYNAARTGVCLYEAAPHAWPTYQGQAIKAWDDARQADRWIAASLKRSLQEWGVL